MRREQEQEARRAIIKAAQEKASRELEAARRAERERKKLEELEAARLAVEQAAREEERQKLLEVEREVLMPDL